MLNKLRNLKFSRKILLLGVGSVLLTVIALMAMIAWQSTQFTMLAQDEVNQLVDADLKHIVEGVTNLIKAQSDSAQRQVNYNLNVARHVLDDAGPVTLSPETVEWKAVNQGTQETVTAQLPKMLVGGKWLGQNADSTIATPIIDRVAILLSNSATIFQRMNKQGDMLRVATNITAEGKRAIGTYIPAIDPDGSPNPVISTVLRGETYRGDAFVVDSWYSAAYEAIRDQSGEVVGMLFVGVKRDNIYSLRQAIRDTLVGKTGHVYILGTEGNERGHYIVAPELRFDNVDVWDTQDVTGQYIFQSIVNKAVTLKPDEGDSKRYAVQHAGEALRWKIDQFGYYEPWHWVIVASAYEDEFANYQATLQQRQADLFNVSTLIGLVIALVAGVGSVVLARSISRPIIQLAQAASEVAGGNLNVSTVITRQKDEIGGLAKAFNSMTAQLRDLIGNLEQRVTQRTAELEQSAADLEQRGLELQLLNQKLQAAGQQAEWRARQLTISAQVAHTVGQVRDLDQLLSQVTHLIGTAFGFYHVGIFIVDEINRFAVLRAANSEGGQRMLSRNHKLAVGQQGLVGYVTSTGQPRIALDVGADATHFNNPDLPATRSEIALPLQVGGRMLGALDLQTTQPGAFSSEDMVALGTLADQIAVAIENARLFSQTLAALQETEEANRRQLREKWQHLLPTLTSSYEYHLSGVPPIGDALLPEIEQAIRRGEVVIASGDTTTAKGSDTPARAALAVPIKLRDQIIGVIDLQETDHDRQWTDDEIAVLMAVADQAALALDNARLLEETEQSAQREKAVANAADKIHRSTDIEAVLHSAVAELSRITGRSGISIQLGFGHAGVQHNQSVGNGQSMGQPGHEGPEGDR